MASTTDDGQDEPDEKYDDYVDSDSDLTIGEYNITAVPSDFNVMTLDQLRTED